MSEVTTIVFSDGRPLAVESEGDLLTKLEGLAHLQHGDSVTLVRKPKHYIRAVRHGEFWSVMARAGGFWTLASFTAAMTTDHSAYQVAQSRAARSIWKRAIQYMMLPAHERLLSTAQVMTVFAEFFSGKRFSIPQSGA